MRKYRIRMKNEFIGKENLGLCKIKNRIVKDIKSTMT